MQVLVACEESQRVCIEFRKLGHEAYSCDIEPCSGGHEEWHIQNDVIPLLNGNCEFQTVDGAVHRIDGKWDMIIAFPPCTYLSNAGARHLWKNHELNQERYKKGLAAKEFFMQIFNADCERIAIENPTPSKIYELPEKSQVIQPYQFGHPYTKRTQLWLKGLLPLEPKEIVEPIAHGVQAVHILTITEINTEECLQQIEPRTERKPLKALQRLWLNSLAVYRWRRGNCDGRIHS